MAKQGRLKAAGLAAELVTGARTKRIKRVTALFPQLCEQLAEHTKECHLGATFHTSRAELESVWYATPFMRTRDSDALEESNYQVIQADLIRVALSGDNVTDHRFGHWGCGWFEQLYIRKDDPRLLLAVQGWINALSDYPIADEMHYSNLEWDRDHPGTHVGECYCDNDDCSVRAERCKGRGGYTCYGEAGEDGYCTDGSCEADD